MWCCPLSCETQNMSKQRRRKKWTGRGQTDWLPNVGVSIPLCSHSIPEPRHQYKGMRGYCCSFLQKLAVPEAKEAFLMRWVEFAARNRFYCKAVTRGVDHVIFEKGLRKIWVWFLQRERSSCPWRRRSFISSLDTIAMANWMGVMWNRSNCPAFDKQWNGCQKSCTCVSIHHEANCSHVVCDKRK